MLKDLVKVANRLDSLGLTKEADTLDFFIQKEASDFAHRRGIGSHNLDRLVYNRHTFSHRELLICFLIIILDSCMQMLF